MEKLRIYLDTNIIHSWFRKFMESKKKNIEFVEPKILQFIFGLENEYIVSNITKTEIFRSMFADWVTGENECNEAWARFLANYKITIASVREIDFDELTRICLIVKTKKKTLVNLMHMQIAKKGDVWFLTGEDRLIEKYKQYYNKTLSYENLRKLFSA